MKIELNRVENCELLNDRIKTRIWGCENNELIK